MMKERTTPKSVTPQKVKGTVLFTVVCVMLILVVFLMGAMALSVTANNRAMKNYNAVQTQATAKAGVRALLSTIQNDVDFARSVADLKSGSAPIVFSDEDIKFESIAYDSESSTYGYTEDSSLGKIKEASISYVGSKYVIEDGVPAEKAVIKFSATAEQGLDESTVAVYMLRSVDGKVEDSAPGGGGGFVSTGSIAQQNHTSAFGGTYVGFNKELDKVDLKFGNPATFETPVHVNGSFLGTGGSGKVNFVFRKPGDGVTIWGDMDLSNDENGIATVTNFANTNDLTTLDYKQIPYIYIDGEFKLGQNSGLDLGNAEMPLNIFCDSFNITTGNDRKPIYADVYCFNPDKTNVYRGSNGNKLLKWTETVIDPDNTSGANHDAGNFFTKGSLETDGQSQFDGDVCVDGNFHVKDGVTTIKGDLKVNGTLTVDGTLNVTGALHAATDIPAGKGTRGTYVAVTNEMKPGYNSKVVNETQMVPDGPKYKYAILDSSNAIIASDQYGSWGLGETPRIEGDKLIDSYGNDKTVSVGTTIPAGATIKVDYTAMKPVEVPVTKYYKEPDDTVYVSYAEAHSAGTNFPPYYEKKVITGAELFEGKDGQIVKTVQNILDDLKPYDMPKNYPANVATSVEGNTLNLSTSAIVNKDANAITGGSGAYTITESCTISGSTSGATINFKPDTKNIWVLLDGDMTLSGGTQFIVDDTAGGSVSFLLNGDVNFPSTSQAKPPFLSKKFDDLIKSDSDFQIVTSDQTSISGLPTLGSLGVFIYTTDGEHLLKFQNKQVVTANICSPNLVVQYEDGGVSNLYTAFGTSGRIYYDGYQVIKKGSKSTTLLKDLYGNESGEPVPEDIGIIGCCICKEFKCTNDWDLLYVPSTVAHDPSPDTPDEDALMTGWKLLYYENY